MRKSRPIAFAGILTLTALLGSACSESTVAGGTGNDVIDDTRPEPRPPANPDPPVDASADVSDALTSADGAAPATCGGCACTPDAHYCFGGAPPRGLDPVSPDVADAASSSDAGDGGDAGPAACPLPPDASTVQAGCNDLPAECAAAPSCECILNALQPKYSCYLVCKVPGPQFLVYCPNP